MQVIQVALDWYFASLHEDKKIRSLWLPKGGHFFAPWCLDSYLRNNVLNRFGECLT